MKYEDDEEDDGEEQTTRAEIEANLTASIEDELILICTIKNDPKSAHADNTCNTYRIEVTETSF